MADLKISQLTSASALAGTETLPVVQSGATKKATVDQLLTPAAGKGIDFSANPNAAGMTSELFNWYEEGTWTGTLTGTGGAPTTPITKTGRYTRIGRVVHLTISFANVNTTGASGNILITGVPYANNSSADTYGTVALGNQGANVGLAYLAAGANTLGVVNATTTASIAINAVANAWVEINITYTVA